MRTHAYERIGETQKVARTRTSESEESEMYQKCARTRTSEKILAQKRARTRTSDKNKVAWIRSHAYERRDTPKVF